METYRRYAISTALSFFTGFAIVLVANIDDVTIQSFKDGTIFGLVFAAARAGLKAVLEAYLAWRAAQ
jgi:hypothetical protein